MKRLPVRIFFAIWGASALIGLAIAVTEATRDAGSMSLPEERLLREAVAREAEAILRGRDGGLEERTGVTLWVWDADARPVAGGPVPERLAALARRALHGGDRTEAVSDTFALAVRVEGGVAVVEIPRRPRWARALATDSFALRAAIVIGVSAFVALLMARLVTRPIDRLREVTRRISAGDLSARASSELSGAGVELEALAADFDAMAVRIEALVSARDRLLSDVSHELNSPLARLRVALELARRSASDEAAPMLDKIEREAQRLGALVDEIMTLRRLESDGAIETNEVGLGALLEEVAHDAAFEAQVRDVRVKFERSEAVSVIGDRVLLRRALDNVVRNAIRHTEMGTEVEVLVTSDAESVQIEVCDRGPGVPEDQLEVIFDPLVRLEAHRDPFGGSGLGLAIAKRAVLAHGGSIGAENRDSGGLAVTLRLPRAPTNFHTS